MKANKELRCAVVNLTHTHIGLSIGELEELADKYLEESQKHNSKLAYFYLGKREMLLDIIAKYNELEMATQAKSGMI